MGLNSGTVIIPGKGTVFFGPPNALPLVKATLDPADPATYAGWECAGHTSRDNTVALSKSGGDATTKGSWWDDALVSSLAPVSWGVTVNSLQIDYLTLISAFPNGRVTSTGKFAIPSGVSSIERSCYILCIDGSKRFGIDFPRLSLSLGDAPSVSVDSFFEIQLSGSALSATAAAGTEIAIGDLIVLDPVVAVAVPVPAVLGATPAAATAGSTLTLTGSNFTGATAVTTGGTALTGVVVGAGGTSLTGVMPAGTAGSAPIVVTTPAGASASYAYVRGA